MMQVHRKQANAALWDEAGDGNRDHIEDREGTLDSSSARDQHSFEEKSMPT